MHTLKTYLTKSWVVCVLALLCCFLWGSAFPCVKIGYNLFQISSTDIGSQILFAGCRFTLAGLLTVLIGSCLQRKVLYPQRTSLGYVAILSMVQTIVQYLFFYQGLAHTSSVKSSIINGSSAFLALLVSSLVFRFEKLTFLKFSGCLIGFAGVILINLSGDGLGGGFHVQGEGFIFLAAVSYALSSSLLKAYSQRENPVTLSGYQFFLGGIVLVLVGTGMGGRLNHLGPAACILLLYMAMISAVAYSLWGILLKYNPVGRITIYSFSTPLFGVILSILLLKGQSQTFGLRGVVALALVCSGIYLVNREGKTNRH